MTKSLYPFFPDMRLRCISPAGIEFGGVFVEKENHMIIVGNSGVEYDTLELFFMLECGGESQIDPWEVCEFWKSWSWWKCKEMLPPKATNQMHLRLQELIQL
jgi:hypothetical protein